MMPLGKALHLRTGRNYLLYVLGIVTGATMAHSLVPPTPGPLFVANRLGVDLATMILVGSVVGLITAGAGFLFALWVNRRMEVPLRSSEDAPLERLRELMSADERHLPPLWLALTPILLPVVLIAGSTVADSVLGKEGALEGWRWLVTTLGDANVALMLAAGVAVAMLAWTRRGQGRREIAPAVASALASAGVIILITGGGGAFGAAIRESGVGDRIRELSGGHVPLLPLAFFITVLIRTAQGSATVAMMTAVAVVQDLYVPSALDYHPVYLALAIGCGSKPFAWMNDSGFWVITRMSGLTEAEALRTVTPMSAIMGFTGLGVLLVAVNVFPLV
jgi:GntP family gluconate:H+ symporter